MPAHRLPGLAIAALVLLCVLIAGCIGADYVPNHDVIIIKLHPDGTTAWTRTLDTGFDDVAGDIVEIPSADLIIAGGNASRRYEAPVPKLTRLSGSGAILSEIPCPSMGGKLTSLALTTGGNLTAASYDGNVGFFDRAGNLVAVTPTGMTGVWTLAPAPAGGVAVAGVLYQQYPAGSVAAYDANGSLITRAPFANETVETPGCRETILESGDRRIPVTECVGPSRSTEQGAVTVIDRNETITWQNGYGAYGFASAWSIAAADGGDGYYVGGYGSGPDGSAGHRLAARISSNGSKAWVADLGPVFSYYPAPWIIRPGSAREIIPEEYAMGNNSVGTRPEIVSFDNAGGVSGKFGIPASRILVPTSDGGFFSAGFPAGTGQEGYTEMTGSGGGALHALKFRADGSREWDRIAGDGSADTVVAVIQARDGGYVILAERQNR
jgi:hypothetical protein